MFLQLVECFVLGITGHLHKVPCRLSCEEVRKGREGAVWLREFPRRKRMVT